MVGDSRKLPVLTPGQAIVAPGRACGNCTACCTALRVDEVEKVDYERCRHLGKLGCKIYSKRPDGCRAYACMWLQGIATRDERPDRLGLVFSHMWSDIHGEHVLVHEVRRGAMSTLRAQALVQVIANRRLIFQVIPDGRLKLIGGPRDQVREAVAKARERGVLEMTKR